MLDLLDDMLELQPTIFLSVPRLYNRVYDRVMGAIREGNPVARRLFETAYSSKRAALSRGDLSGGSLAPLWDRLVFSKVAARLGGDSLLICPGLGIDQGLVSFGIDLQPQCMLLLPTCCPSRAVHASQTLLCVLAPYEAVVAVVQAQHRRKQPHSCSSHSPDSMGPGQARCGSWSAAPPPCPAASWSFYASASPEPRSSRATA